MQNQLAEFRAFNRFYTSMLGLLDRHYLNSEFSLTEVRILYELNHAQQGITAKELAESLQLDKGYLSRILQQFEKKLLVAKEKSLQDGRSAFLHLTDKGISAFKPLDLAARQQASELLGALPANDVKQLLKSMAVIQAILNKVNITHHE
jgi:MarR family transcriptional regulator, organic hydroperoxide resistance regulator